MKKFSDFLSKSTLFAIADLSAPTKINEQLIGSLKSRAAVTRQDYIVYTPKKAHNVFSECKYTISNSSAATIIESKSKHILFEYSTDHNLAEHSIYQDGNIALFKNYLVEGISDSEAVAYLNEIRSELDLPEVVVEHKPNELRESYIAGKIFRQGSTVICEDNQRAEVLTRGTNFVQVISEDGIISNKFLEQLIESTDSLKYDELSESSNTIEYKTYKSENLSEEFVAVLREHFSDKINTAKAISTIQKFDAALSNLEDLTNLNYINKFVVETNLSSELLDLIEEKILTESEETEPHVVYNNKTDSVHSEHKTKADAYSHLIDKLHFDKNHTVIPKSSIDSHKVQNAKIKKIFPNRYNESKDYNLANDIVDYSEYKKMKCDTLRNGMTHKKSSVIKLPLVKETFSFIEKDFDDMVNEVTLIDILDAYDASEFVTVSNEFSLYENHVVLGNLQLIEKSTQAEINARALKIAKTTLRKKLAMIPLKDLSKEDRNKLERIVAANPSSVNTIAMKLSPHIKKIELTNLIKKED